MTLTILGLVLWYAGHLFKRLLPGPRQSLGDAGRGLVALTVLAGVALMVIGYRGWAAPMVWAPPSWATHVNNILMLFAFYCYAASGTKARLATKLRHPQLTGFALWTAAHLLVNGDLASLVLFGGLLLWAAVETMLINGAEPDWTPPVHKGRAAEIRAVVDTLVVFALVAGIHTWLGHRPFPA